MLKYRPEQNFLKPNYEFLMFKSWFLDKRVEINQMN